MVKRKWDHLPRKQVDPVQDLFDVLMLTSKVSRTGLTPAQCPFFPCSLPSYCSFWANQHFCGKVASVTDDDLLRHWGTRMTCPEP